MADTVIDNTELEEEEVIETPSPLEYIPAALDSMDILKELDGKPLTDEEKEIYDANKSHIDFLMTYPDFPTTLVKLFTNISTFSRVAPELAEYVPKPEVKVEVPLTQEQQIEKMSEELEYFIYSAYPARKQDKDKSYIVATKANIIATDTSLSEDSVTRDVTTAVSALLAGTSDMKTYLADKPDELKFDYKKLYKASARLAWTYVCVKTFYGSLEAGVKAVYPPFPTFK